MMEPHRDDQIQTAGPLFELVQLLHLYSDSKRFPDSRPRRQAAEIEEEVRTCLAEWSSRRRQDATEANLRCGQSLMASAIADSRDLLELASRLRRIIDECFEPPNVSPEHGHECSLGTSMEEHIDAMWDRLIRPSMEPDEGSTLLAMPYPDVVPGGRYAETYYWDTYFTCLGLVGTDREELLEGIVDNMADQIRQYGFVPCGARTYYLSRSQQPYFLYMLRLLAGVKGEDVARNYVDELRREYEYWSGGSRAVELEGGPSDVLSRYWDTCPEPRPEGYREDLATWREARDLHQRVDREGLFRDIRAATESGWDFSSRWLTPAPDGRWSLARIRTTSILPIDLNCLVYDMELQLARWTEGAEADEYRERARRRAERLRQPPFWQPERGWFDDAVIGEGSLASTGVESLAGVYPLFCGLADDEQAARVAHRVESCFLKPGGVVATTDAFRSGEQWDCPNGWPPLQWVTVAGLHRYGHRDLAREVARRFVDQVRAFYHRTGAMMEKFNVHEPDRLAGGGEYPNQEGFGWTNGVTLALLRYLDRGELIE